MDRATIEKRLAMLKPLCVGREINDKLLADVTSLLLYPETPVVEAVVSSNVDQVGYDLNSQSLTVIFKGGARYRYLAVGPSMAMSFMAAESKGKALQEVKAHYTCVKD